MNPSSNHSLSTRPYLEQTVVAVLMQGMTELAKERPDNPLEFLGKYLLSRAGETGDSNYSNNNNTHNNNNNSKKGDNNQSKRVENDKDKDKDKSRILPPNTNSTSITKSNNSNNPVNKIDWSNIKKKLNLERTEDGRAERTKLFNAFDVNGKGHLGIKEVNKGITEVLGIQELIDCKPVILRAFQAARALGKKSAKNNDSTIERNEFKRLLRYLRQYFEYYEMFKKLDASHDDKVSLDEFKHALPILEKWGVKVTNAEKTFKEIDTSGEGEILFDEFSHWAIQKNLDLVEDDDDVDEGGNAKADSTTKKKK
jgi:Ca2+-binding EF-hand superfamily protein